MKQPRSLVLGAAGGATLGGGWGKLEGARELQVTVQQVQMPSFSTLQESVDKSREEGRGEEAGCCTAAETGRTLYTCPYRARLSLRFLGL